MSIAIAPPSYSYSFQNKIRDVDQIFRTLLAQTPTFAGLVGFGMDATNTKHEWMEEQITPTNSAIASFDTDGDGTGINLTSTAGIEVGSILRFTTAAAVTRTELVVVTTVDSATDLTVVRDYASSTGVTLQVGDLVYLVASPRLEGTLATANTGQEAGMNYNYTQIFDKSPQVTLTSQAVKMYGLENAINKQVEFQMAKMAYDLNNSAIFGRRLIGSAGVPSTMGGVLQYLESGNIDTTGGAVSSTIINNILESIYLDGNPVKDLVILCNTNQARKISAFLTAANQPVINKLDSPLQTSGFAINKVNGDLPAAGGTFGATVAVDPQFPKDQLAILDMSKIQFNTLSGRGIVDKDATPPAADYIQRRLIGELTMTVKDGTFSHGLATGLTV